MCNEVKDYDDPRSIKPMIGSIERNNKCYTSVKSDWVPFHFEISCLCKCQMVHLTLSSSLTLVYNDYDYAPTKKGGPGIICSKPVKATANSEKSIKTKLSRNVDEYF